MGIAVPGVGLQVGTRQSHEVLTMHELKDICDPATIYARAEPDDEYDPRPEPVDPYMIDQDEYDIEDDGSLVEDDEDEE
jgi:hypothetical protein